MPDDPTIDSREQRLNALLAEYCEARARGQAPDRQELLGRHPDLAGDLAEFFADDQRLRRLAQPAGSTPDAGPAARSSPADQPTGAPGNPAGEGSPRAVVRYFGDYEILEEIARGGMGIVYKARQLSLNRTVALKMILAGQLASPADVQRFRTEAEAAAGLDHPNIVPIYEVGEHEGQHYFSMKLVEGNNLASQVLALVQAPREAARLLGQVARAIHYAHQRGILHRDLKPANILLDSRGDPHVTDFGLAKRVEGGSNLTQSGAIVGTPSYMAPEQASGARSRLSTAVDVYSLGAILYELLTCEPPFRAETPLDTLMQVLEKEPRPPHAINPKVDRDLETICLKCLEKDPGRRYGSAEALADDLERWLAGEPIQARRSTAWERAVKWAKRRPALAALAGVSALAAAALLIVGLWFNAEVATQKEAVKKVRAEADQELEKARKLNEQAQGKVKETTAALAEAQRNVAFSYIAAAHREWYANNVDRAVQFLEKCPTRFRGWEWHYINRLSRAGWLASYPIQANNVVFSPTGKSIAAVEGQHCVVRDTATGKVKFATPDLGKGPHPLVFSPDGKHLALMEATKEERGGDYLIPSVQIFDAQTGRKVSEHVCHKSCYCLTFTRRGKLLAAGRLDTGHVGVYDVQAG
jgi:predicted Ser/Thr protein kinase